MKSETPPAMEGSEETGSASRKARLVSGMRAQRKTEHFPAGKPFLWAENFKWNLKGVCNEKTMVDGFIGFAASLSGVPNDEYRRSIAGE